MNLLENFDSNIDYNMVFLDNVDNTKNIDRLEYNLWEAKRSCFQHFDLNYPLPVRSNADRMYFPGQPRNFQSLVYAPTRPHQTAQDVVVIDDDIAIISPNIFDQARKKARRNRENVNIANQASRVPQFHGLSQPVPPPQLPGSSQTMPPPQFPGFSQTPAQVSGLSQAVPPPAAPAFCCPICMDELQEATSTKCGHIFCKDCIKKALAVQKKCPACRMKCRAKSIYRIFLPAVL